MFQDFALFPHLRVLDNVAFGLRGLDAAGGAGSGPRSCSPRSTSSGHADSYPHMLSGGEQQRVALARALAPEPRVILLDEPFSSLDATLREHVRDDAIAVLRRAGTPVLMVTHDADEAVRVADRIHVMLDGPDPAAAARRPSSTRVRRRPSWPASSARSTASRAGSSPARSARRSGRSRSPTWPTARAVDVLIRPEALRLLARRRRDAHRFRGRTGSAISAPIGCWSCELPDGPLLTVRMTGITDFVVGDMVAVEIDPQPDLYLPREGALG